MAKSAGQQKPKQRWMSPSRRHFYNQWLIKPNFTKVQDTTKGFQGFPCHDINTEPLLLDIIESLTNFDGGAHSLTESRQIFADVSKYLAFAKTRAQWLSLNNVESQGVYAAFDKGRHWPQQPEAVKYCMRVKLLDRQDAGEACWILSRIVNLCRVVHHGSFIAPLPSLYTTL